MTHDYRIHGFGVRLHLEGELAARFATGLLPQLSQQSLEEPDCTFRLQARDGTLALEQDGLQLIEGQNPAVVAQVLQGRLHELIGSRAPVPLSLKGGAVGWQGRAWLFPAEPLTGTTRMVEELVRLGATRYSDRLIVFEESLQVVPYQGDPGADLQAPPLPVAGIARITYRTGEGLDLQPQTAGQTTLHLLPLATSAQAEVGAVMRMLSQIAVSARCFQGWRGETGSSCPNLLELLGS
jgi:hypothetical protein